jgi:tetratricopeptide (TPR) repeat protein
MTEEADRAGSATENPGVSADPVAVALALGGASQAQADAFLKKQEAFIDDQRHHLRRQYTQLDLGIWQQRLGVFLRVATAFVGLAVAGFLAWMIWNAANSNDLVIDSFAAPADLEARGLSGPVVAAKLSDKIAAIQAQTISIRPAKSYANGLAAGLKLEIPETGVSLSELDRFLRERLGHDLHIGGEMVHTDQGMALTARIGSEGSATVTGTETGLDPLLQKLAEQVYRITQPYRYAIWLIAQGRAEEAIAVHKALAASGPNGERAWAYLGWGLATNQYHSEYEGLALVRRGRALDVNNYLCVANIAASEQRFGRAQDSQRDFSASLALVLAHGRDYSLPDPLSGEEHWSRAEGLMYQGMLLEAVEQARRAVAASIDTDPIGYAAVLAQLLSALHEPNAARAVLTENPIAVSNLPNIGSRLDTELYTRLLIALEAQDWPGVLAAEAALPQILAKYPGLADTRPTMFDPPAAIALAHLKQFTAAEMRLKATPADCYPCLRARARVAALQQQDRQADLWFARAVAAAPSMPYAESEWGRALLDRGQPDAAIVKFAVSNRKGAHFADPLEGWGEALMAKNQSHLALAKFAEAEKYAPNWGRLHLNWGEALYYAGKRDEARAQFARAAALDLTPAEKSELARHA